MKKRTKLLVMMLLGVLLSINQVWAVDPTVIYSETFGTNGNSGTKTCAWSSYTYFSNAQSLISTISNPTFVSSAAWVISKPGATNVCDVVGTSANSFMQTSTINAAVVFVFGDLSTQYTSATFSFNYANDASLKNSATDRTIKCVVSSDGGNTWGENVIPVNKTSQGWTAVSYNIPASALSNLAIKIYASAGNTSRVDDIILTGTPSAPGSTYTVDKLERKFRATSFIVS